MLVDYRHKLPGRGAYTCLDRNCIESAVKRRQFDRAFRSSTRGQDAAVLREALQQQIRERILNLLGMARKSANVVSGSSLVMDSLGGRSGLALVLMADDVSAAIGEKVAAKAAMAGIPCFRLFDKGIIGQVLGKGERSVVALKDGPLAESVKTELSRYENIVGES
jgi:ribosomal protein L7Ae-like RNA K-turn-binding protein